MHEMAKYDMTIKVISIGINFFNEIYLKYFIVIRRDWTTANKPDRAVASP